MLLSLRIYFPLENKQSYSSKTFQYILGFYTHNYEMV